MVRRTVRCVDLRDAFALAEYLLEVHGLDDWEVAYDNAKRRAGICRFGERTLGLSAPLTAVHSDEDVRDTILHEIAHALVGPQHGHDATWEARARAIGCSGARCVSPDAPTAPAAWLGVCPAGHTLRNPSGPLGTTGVFDVGFPYTVGFLVVAAVVVLVFASWPSPGACTPRSALSFVVRRSAMGGGPLRSVVA